MQVDNILMPVRSSSAQKISYKHFLILVINNMIQVAHFSLKPYLLFQISSI